MLSTAQEVIDHLAHDIDVLRESRLLKLYAEGFCNNSRPMSLSYIEPGGGTHTFPGMLRWR